MKPTLPPRDKRAKTGTNIRGGVMAAHRSRLFKKQLGPLKRLVYGYQRAAKKLFSKADLRTASAIMRRLQHESRVANIKLGPDASKWEANNLKLRARVQRELGKALPQMREWRAVTADFQRDYQQLIQAQLAWPRAGDVHIDFGEIAPPDSGNTQEFFPPFGLHDVSIEEATNYPEVKDHSFAIPSSGHVVNNLELEYDDDTSILNGFFGLYLPVYGWSRAGCGINYVVPTTGRLRIGAALRNFHSRVKMSLEDNFGFSMGRVYGSANLYVEIVRGRNITTLSETLVEKTLESDGDDTSTTLPNLDDTVPFSIDVTTDETFEAGAAVQILAGSEFVSGCMLDDMVANVKALLWSQVQKITVEVV
jgi:hypothetical protein